MKITAVIPTLNEEKDLEKCLTSLKNQKPEIEIIVIDGGSADNTIEIAKKYTNKVYNLKKRGIGIARQFGAEKANGKYIYMTDADCWSDSGLLNSLKEKLEKNKMIAITGPTKYHGLNGKIMQMWYYFFDKYYFTHKYGTIGLSGRNTLIVKDKLLLAMEGKIMPNFWEDGFISFHLKKYGNFLYDNNLCNFSQERRIRNPLTLIKTIKMYIQGMKEMNDTGNIVSCHLPTTNGRRVD